MLQSRQLTRNVPLKALTSRQIAAKTIRTFHPSLQSIRTYASDDTDSSTASKDSSLNAVSKPTEDPKPKKKTQAELDQELQLNLAGLAGDGGEAGVEYEDGKPVSMKRSVKNNMFRYI